MVATQSPASLSIRAMPTTLDDLLALRDEIATTPEGGAVVLLLALMRYAQTPDTSSGPEALTVAIDPSRLVEDAGSSRGWSLSVRDRQHLARQLAGRPWVLHSYVIGTSPATGYAMPAAPYRFDISRNPYSGDEKAGQVKVFVASSGAASPRPVTLRRNARGLWKAVEWSSLTMGVQPPSLQVADDL